MNTKGFTFIEVLIASSLVGVVILTIAGLYVSGSRTFRNELYRSSVQLDSRTKLKQIRDVVLQGNSIAPNWTNGTDTYISSTNLIVIDVPSIDANSNFIYAGGTTPKVDEFVYWTDANKKLWRLVDASNSDPSVRQSENAHVIENGATLSFTYDQDPSTGNVKKVDIDLKIENTVNGQTYSSENKTSALLRNK